MLGALARRVLPSSSSATMTAAVAARRIGMATTPTTTISPAIILPAAARAAGGWVRTLSTEAEPAAAAAAGADVPLEALEKPRPPRNSLVGTVVSDRMDKSIVVRVSRIKLFLPYMVRKRTFKKVMAHDEENTCGVGDTVRIKPSRPLSKRKRFTLHEILRRDPKQSLQQEGEESTVAAAASSSSS